MSNEASRKAFELQITSRLGDTAKLADGSYANASVNNDWQVWQASRKALEAEQAKPGDENTVEYWKAYSEAQDSSFDVMMVELKLLRAAQTVGSTVKQPLSIERAVEPFAWVVLDYEDVPIYCAPAKQMCNDHINEAISEYCIAEAGGWSIREAFSHPAPPPAEPHVKQPLSTERAEVVAGLRDAHARRLGHGPSVFSNAADMLEADAPSANYVMLEQVVIALTDENTKLAALLEQAQQVAAPQVPIARFNWGKGRFEWLTDYSFDLHNMKPLYLAPPPAEPTVTQPLSTERGAPTKSASTRMKEAGSGNANLVCFMQLEIADLRAEIEELKAQQVAVPVNKREPLSDGLIDVVTRAQWGEMQGYPLAAHRAYARAIEAHHGITPQGDKT